MAGGSSLGILGEAGVYLEMTQEGRARSAATPCLHLLLFLLQPALEAVEPNLPLEMP